jgi:hypothetical protein
MPHFVYFTPAKGIRTKLNERKHRLKVLRLEQTKEPNFETQLSGCHLFVDLFSSQTPMFRYEAMLTHKM